MTPEQPRIVIVILNWNGLNDTTECLDSLRQMDYPNYDVVVVDNGSAVDEAAVLQDQFGDYIHLVRNDRNYGFAEGCNIGIRYAQQNWSPDYVLLLNNDTAVDHQLVRELVLVGESDPAIGIVGAKVRFYYDPDKIQSAGGWANLWTGQVGMIGCGEEDVGQFGKVTDVDWVLGCAMLLKSTAIQEIGLLHTDFFAYFEETDYCLRCKRAGYRVVYAPKAQLRHKRKLAVGHMDRFRVYYVTRNRYLFVKRNATKLQFSFFFLQALLRDGLLTPLMLLVRQRQPKLLPTHYRATCEGMRMALTRAQHAGESPLSAHGEH